MWSTACAELRPKSRQMPPAALRNGNRCGMHQDSVGEAEVDGE